MINRPAFCNRCGRRDAHIQQIPGGHLWNRCPACGVGEHTWSPGYPSPVDIMRDPPLHRRAVLGIVRTWKRNEWGNVRRLEAQNRRYLQAERFNAIKLLLQRLDAHYTEIGERPLEVMFVANGMDNRGGGWYTAETKTIYLGTPSILTALHEFAHHLGKNERAACRWSIHLFRKTFPRAYNRLRWDGHMLRR